MAALQTLGSGCLAAPPTPSGRTAVLTVGPTRRIRTLGEAARLARDGDTIEVDAGEYRGDVALWTQDRLSIRAVGGRARLLADGAIAEGKGIWVLRGGRIDVAGFDFEGARAATRNGAGIRFERGELRVHDCRFFDNEMGLLTGNDPTARLIVENSEFAHNRRPDGHNHGLYAGTIAALEVRGSYFHHGFIGHLLKSRAAVNRILYNRLTDEAAGRASYELEFPNGGVARVVGNIIQQAPGTDNPIMLSYGAEGYRWADNVLELAHNTWVDDRPTGGQYLRVMPGEVQVIGLNNLLAGNPGRLEDAAPGEFEGNLRVDREAFVEAALYDYRLREDAAPREPAPGRWPQLQPTHQYQHPRATRPLHLARLQPGAVQ
jgi:hypothetical protein